MVTTYEEGQASPTKEGIYFIRIHDENDALFVEYSTAPIPDPGRPIYEYQAVMRRPRITPSSVDMPTAKIRFPSFSCDLIDRISQQDKWSRVSYDLLGSRSLPSYRPRLQILNRRLKVFHGYQGMQKTDYREMFDGFISGLEDKGSGIFRLKCDGSMKLLDRPIFRHIKGRTTIATGGGLRYTYDDYQIPVTSHTNFNDPQDSTYPFDCFAYVTKEDGSQTILYQYGAKTLATVDRLVIAQSGDDIWGGTMYSTAQSGNAGDDVWTVGDEVWEAMSFEMNPIRFALWIMETSGGGELGPYDRGVSDFGLAIPYTYIDEPGLTQLIADFKDHQFRFYRNYKELIEEPVNGFDFIRDEICKPLGLMLTSTTEGKITFQKITGGAIAGTITDDDMVRPPEQDWSDDLVYGEIQFFTDPYDHYDYLDEFRHKWIHGYTGTGSVFPYSIERRRLKLKSRAVVDDLYTHNLESGSTNDSVGNAGFIYWSYYNTVFPNFAEPYPTVKVECHHTKSSYPAGSRVTVDSAFLHQLGAFDDGGRGITNEGMKVLERKFKETTVEYKLWRNEIPPWMDNNSTFNINFTPDNATVAITQIAAFDPDSLGARWESPVIDTSNDGYFVNTEGYKGQFLQLQLEFSCQALTRTYSDIYPRIMFVMQAGEISSTPVDFIDVTAAYFFEITWAPPAGTQTFTFYALVLSCHMTISLTISA